MRLKASSGGLGNNTAMLIIIIEDTYLAPLTSQWHRWDLTPGGMPLKSAMLLSFHLFKSSCYGNSTSMIFVISAKLSRERQHFYLLIYSGEWLSNDLMAYKGQIMIVHFREHLSCTWCFSCFTLLNNQSSHFHRLGARGTERLSDFPKLIQTAKGRIQIWTQTLHLCNVCL